MCGWKIGRTGGCCQKTLLLYHIASRASVKVIIMATNLNYEFLSEKKSNQIHLFFSLSKLNMAALRKSKVAYEN